DEYGEGYPVAHFFPNNLYYHTLIALFSSLHCLIPDLNVNTVMTDDDAANTFDDIHHKIDKVKDIHVQYNKVVEKAECLFKVDDEIKECIMFTDEEYDTTESYRDRFTEIRVVYEKQYTEDKSSSVVSRKYSHDNLKLPKLRMKELNREDKEDDPVVSKDKVLENFMTFLHDEVEGEEHRFLAETSFGDGMKRKESNKPPLRDEPTAAILIANTSVGRNQCIFCESAHASQDCQKISNLAYEDRKGQVIRKRCCLVCLKPGHIAKRCHSFVKYLICGRRHYALLCPDLRKDKISSKSREVDEEQHSTETLLTNFPSELAELNLSPSGTEVLSQGLFGGGISPSMEYGRFTVTVESLDRKYSTSMSLLDQPKIFSTLPRISDRNLIAELASRGIKLIDVGQDTPPIRVLLGADVLGRILTGRVEILAFGISAIETLLVWTILGLGKKKQSVYMVTLALQNIELPKIWDLEVLGIKDPIERKNKSILAEETLLHFKETVKLKRSTKYEVEIPLVIGHPPLSNMHFWGLNLAYFSSKKSVKMKKEI
ncbi:hypothetical protein HNY73_000001, partial [Argiope bruennichi]